MSRTVFLTLAATVACLIGAIALIAPDFLLGEMKRAAANPAAITMTQTTGVLLVTFGLAFAMVRRHPDSASLRSLLIAGAILQILILPIDPLAWAAGTFAGFGSFVPNTILHLALLYGFVHFARRIRLP